MKSYEFPYFGALNYFILCIGLRWKQAVEASVRLAKAGVTAEETHRMFERIRWLHFNYEKSQRIWPDVKSKRLEAQKETIRRLLSK